MKQILTEKEQYWLKARTMIEMWELEAIEEEKNRPRTKFEKVCCFIYDTIAILFAIGVAAILFIMFTWN